MVRIVTAFLIATFFATSKAGIAGQYKADVSGGSLERGRNGGKPDDQLSRTS